jgi:hypothetical protein
MAALRSATARQQREQELGMAVPPWTWNWTPSSSLHRGLPWHVCPHRAGTPLYPSICPVAAYLCSALIAGLRSQWFTAVRNQTTFRHSSGGHEYLDLICETADSRFALPGSYHRNPIGHVLICMTCCRLMRRCLTWYCHQCLAVPRVVST